MYKQSRSHGFISTFYILKSAINDGTMVLLKVILIV